MTDKERARVNTRVRRMTTVKDHDMEWSEDIPDVNDSGEEGKKRIRKLMVDIIHDEVKANGPDNHS